MYNVLFFEMSCQSFGIDGANLRIIGQLLKICPEKLQLVQQVELVVSPYLGLV